MSYTMEYTLDLGCLGERDVLVEYSVFGKNRPATWDDPPEYAEVELESIFWNGFDILPYLCQTEQDSITDHIYCEVLE